MDDEDDISPDGGDTPEGTDEGGDSQMIPKERLDAVLGKLRGLEGDIASVRETNANLQGQLDAGTKAPAPREYSTGELAQAVQNGEVSQADADTIRDTQLENRIVAKVAETVATTGAQQTRAATVQTDMTRYTEAYPDIKVAGTELRDRIEEEFTYLTSTLGYSKDLGTEVAAIRAVVGPTSRIGKVKKAQPLRETDQQGSSGGDNPPGEGGDKKVKLTTDEKAYYEPRVGKGKMYSTWDDVHAEMKYSNPRIREKMQRHA